MMTFTESLPEWLSKAQSIQHLNVAQHVLAQREVARLRARTPQKPRNPHKPEAVGLKRAILMPTNLLADRSITKLAEHYSVSVGSHEDHKHLNRYSDVTPYDRTRVVVGECEAEEGSAPCGKYLNASWVLERFGGKWWIATQAPLPWTAHAFLSLIQQYSRPPTLPSTSQLPYTRVRTVVQLTEDVENGFRKAHGYFPTTIGQSLILPADRDHSDAPLKVTLLSSDGIPDACCVRSMISITSYKSPTSQPGTPEREIDDADEDVDDNYGEEEKPIVFQHLLFTAWPDHGVPDPDDRENLMAFIKLVDRTNRDTSLTSEPNPDPDPPVIVGCSAGIGRTGSFIAACSLLRAHGFLPLPASPTPGSALPSSPLGPLRERGVEDDMVVQEIDSLREQRPGMVQRNEQIRLIYELLVSAYLER